MQLWLFLSITTIYTTTATEFGDWSVIDHGLTENRYIRDINEFPSHVTADEGRYKRQTSEAVYNVTQCSHNNVESLDEDEYIQVLAKNLQDSNAIAEKAARLIHLMVRFMPREVFVTLARQSSVGVFPLNGLPNIFPEFAEMPVQCQASCSSNAILPDGSTYDCSVWCTTTTYPYQKRYPLNYLWAYGNFSRTFVVENNIACPVAGFNPGGGSENYLIREFGLTVMTRALDEKLRQDVVDAYTNVTSLNTWSGLKNEYDYFMRGTQAWFNGNSNINNAGGMFCTSCGDDFAYRQRQYIKSKDPQLYDILNYVYNNNRDYVNGDTSVCVW